MKNSDLLSASAYTWAMRFVVALAIAAGLQFSGWGSGLVSQYTHPQPYTVDPSVARQTILAIRDRGLANPNYDAKQFVLDEAEISRLQVASGSLSVVTNHELFGLRERLREATAREHAKELTSIEPIYRQERLGRMMFEDAINAHNQYLPKEDNALMKQRLMASLWFVPCFALMALAICLLRILAASQTLEQAAAILVISKRELVWATLWWPLGLSEQGYKPDKLWRQRSAELSYEHRELEWTERCQLAEEQLLGRGAALLATWRAIWTVTKHERAGFRPWQHQWQASWRNAAYLSLVAVVYVAGGARSATADEAKSPLTGIMLHYGGDGRLSEPTYRHLFLFFEGGTTAIFLNQGSDAEVLELDQNVGSGRWGEFSFTAGPYAQVATRDPPLVGYGLTGFLVYAKERLLVTAPGYITRDMLGNTGTLWPDTRALWKLDPKTSVGLGSTFLAGTNLPASHKWGPLVTRQVGRNTSVALRFCPAPLNTGIFRGQSELRATLQIGF